MSTYDARKVIDRAKDVLNLEQDQELAVLLKVSRSTIAAWRRRNSIPAKYLTEIMVVGTVSLNWLLTGVGDRMHSNRTPPSGLSDEQLLEITRLWVSLLLAREELLTSVDEEFQQLSHSLTDENVSHLHFLMNVNLRKIRTAQEDLMKAGITQPRAIFDHLLEIFNLEKEDIPPPPWRMD